VYKDENNTVRIVQGIRKPVSVQKISAMQFTKCINKGCKVYVFQVTNLLGEERKPSLKDFAGLRGFRDVFLEDILELTPRRVIDFSIDILHEFAPVSKEHYRMSIPELIELKNSVTITIR